MTNFSEVLEFIVENYAEIVALDGIMTDAGLVKSYLAQHGYDVPDGWVTEIMHNIEVGLVDVNVREMNVIFAYGARFFSSVEISESPMLIGQIFDWLIEHGYATESSLYLHEHADSKTGMYGWARYAVSWDNTANNTYFIYIGRGNKREAQYVFTAPNYTEGIIEYSNLLTVSAQ